MKGIVLAGGTGSRLYPLTKVTNKHLLPVGKYPMIYYPIYKLVQAGIEEIMIVTGLEHMGDVVRLLGSGKEFGAKFTYKVQDQAGGIAHALNLASGFASGEKIVVILGDNVFEDSLEGSVISFEKQVSGAKIMLKSVKDPERFGVAEIEHECIKSVEEKPLIPKSNLCVTGVYMYDANVFNYIHQLKPSPRGEYEITDVNNLYIKNSRLSFETLDGWWTDAGTAESLLRANILAKDITLWEKIK